MDVQAFLRAVAETVAQRMQQSPPKHDVWRAGDDGTKRQEQISTPQALVDLTEYIRRSIKQTDILVQSQVRVIQQQQQIIKALDDLTIALEDNSKLARKMLKKSDED